MLGLKTLFFTSPQSKFFTRNGKMRDFQKIQIYTELCSESCKKIAVQEYYCD